MFHYHLSWATFQELLLTLLLPSSILPSLPPTLGLFLLFSYNLINYQESYDFLFVFFLDWQEKIRVCSCFGLNLEMGTGYHHHLNFHLHLPHIHFHHHGRKDEMRNIPKGCLAILVGQEGEEQQKFVIPVIYINHPLFVQLLKEAEEEYGFDQKGPITLPCHVEEFRTVQGMIDKDRSLHQHEHHHHHDDHHHHHHVWCFRAWFYLAILRNSVIKVINLIVVLIDYLFIFRLLPY